MLFSGLPRTLSFCLINTGHKHMIRITELKLPLEDLLGQDAQSNTWTRDAQNLNTSEWLAPNQSGPSFAKANSGAGSSSDTLSKDSLKAPSPTHQMDANAPPALLTLIFKTLHLSQEEVSTLSVYKRSFDARKNPLQVVYIVDLALKDEALEDHLLNQKHAVVQLQRAPDMRWSPLVHLETSVMKADQAASGMKPSTLSHAENTHVNEPTAWTPGLFDDAQKIHLLQRAFDEHTKNFLQEHVSPKDGQASRKSSSLTSTPHRPVVVGFGPCGIFAALILAQLGLKPIVIERGKKVRERTKDTWGLWRKSILKTNSNVQFGEGGAGTFSDGKLYSQTKDSRFLGRKVMQEFVKAGAPEEILFAAHPHIGTFKLVKVVESLREQIISLGGEIRFGQQLVNMEFEATAKLKSQDVSQVASRKLQSALIFDESTQSTYALPCHHLILALGHSARDTFARLYDLGVPMMAKPFSIGFRVEHPQSLIDRARWGKHAGHPLLGAADYKLVHHASNHRSVYSFCMCPGGTVVAATSETARVVTNGMSQYSRNERNANAAIVVGIEPEDFRAQEAQIEASFQEEMAQEFVATPTLKLHGKNLLADEVHPLSGVVFQRHLESQAYVMGGQNYHAPAQLVGDFLKDQASISLADVQPSYKPGVHLTNLSGALPQFATQAIREAIPEFAKKVAGFDLPGAIFTGVETRTSSPLRILRNDKLQSTDVEGLYPAGEGAGFAGGILTAAIDGIKVAEALANQVLNQTALKSI